MVCGVSILGYLCRLSGIFWSYVYPPTPPPPPTTTLFPIWSVALLLIKKTIKQLKQLFSGGAQRDVVYLGWPPVAPSYMSPIARGDLQDLSHAISTAMHIAHWAQINFGDLTPYLTYGYSHPRCFLHEANHVKTFFPTIPWLSRRFCQGKYCQGNSSRHPGQKFSERAIRKRARKQHKAE